MRRIGMLGGMSWESTAEYYRLANEIVRDRLGGVHSAVVIVDSVDFADIEELQATGRWAQAGAELAARAAGLQAAGAELLVLCTNTMHKVIAEIEDAVAIPVLHIADSTAERVHAAGLTRVGLLGTAFTMEQPFYRDRLAERGVEVITPDDADRAIVHRVIYEELVRGILSDASRAEYRRIIRALVDAGAEGVILGCTEIELLVSEQDSPVPVFPTTRIHVEDAVARALA